MPVNQSCRYCGSIHLPREFPAYGKRCTECSRINHFMEVCRSARNRIVHNLKQEPDQHHKEVDCIEKVNINSVFYKKYSVIIANLKTSSNQASIIVPYKVDVCSDGNIMHLHIYKKVFPKATKEQLVATKYDNMKLKVYNRTTITQLGMPEVKLHYSN